MFLFLSTNYHSQKIVKKFQWDIFQLIIRSDQYSKTKKKRYSVKVNISNNHYKSLHLSLWNQWKWGIVAWWCLQTTNSKLYLEMQHSCCDYHQMTCKFSLVCINQIICAIMHVHLCVCCLLLLSAAGGGVSFLLPQLKCSEVKCSQLGAVSIFWGHVPLSFFHPNCPGAVWLPAELQLLFGGRKWITQ